MQNLAFLFFQEFPSESAAGGAAATGIMIVWLAVVALVVASIWKVFTKAGEPGWAVLIPIYNLIVMLRIAGKPTWWVLLMLIPFVNIVVFLLTYVAFAEAFGKSVGFGVGMLFLAPIFFPILAWGDAQHHPQPALT